MLMLSWLWDIQIHYSSCKVKRYKCANDQNNNYFQRKSNIQVLTTFPFSGLVSIHLWLTDKPCSFFNNKIAPAGKSVVTIVPFLPISVNPYVPHWEVENLCKTIFSISPILKNRLLNITQSYHSGLQSYYRYQNFLTCKVHRETKALYQALLTHTKDLQCVAGGTSF